jgi:phosphomannomutase
MATTPAPLYICPGESHPISRAVHLSRLAAYYPKCRNCPLRTDTGQLSRQTVDRIETTQKRAERATLFTAEGVRGVYLNQLDRVGVSKIASALACLLWESAPRIARGDSQRKGNRRVGPAVVVGHDERPSAPDIVTAAAAALRRAGCQVIDIQVTTKPCFWFAVEHLQAAAGIFVTGAGYDPSWTGMDFVLRGATPLSHVNGLDTLRRRSEQPFSRPARHAEPQRIFRAAVPYEASLWKHFHALRPLKICCACPSRLTMRTIERIFATLPCTLLPLAVPQRARDLHDATDADLRRLSAAVGETGADLGLIVEEDGQHVAFVDELGQLVPSRTIARLIAEFMLSEHAGGTVIVEPAAAPDLTPQLEPLGTVRAAAGSTLAEMSQALREHKAIFGGGDASLFWFGESFPTCDAILTIARLLGALSRSDEPFSTVAGTAPEHDEPLDVATLANCAPRLGETL